MPIVLPTLLAALAAAVPRAAADGGSPAAALAPAALGGRLVLHDGDRLVTARDARRFTAGKPLAVRLRSGWDVVSARVDDDGFFVARGAPGEWVIESVAAGDAVEFVDPPMALQARAGEVACAGQLDLAFRDLGAELGHGTGRAAVADRCPELAGRLHAAAPGWLVRPRVAAPVTTLPVRRSFWELEDAVRAGYAFRRVGADATEARWSLAAVVGLDRPAGSARAIVATAAFTDAELDGAAARRIVSAGLGYWLGSWVEASAGPKWQLSGPGGAGPGVFEQLRLGPGAFGISVRAEQGKGGGLVSYGLDVSPLWILGALL